MTTLNLQVGQGSDDCYRRLVTSDFALGWGENMIGDNSSSYYDYSVGQRFTGVTIGQGDTVDSATMQLRASDLGGTIPTTYIEGEDADNVVTFVNAADYDGRARTSAVTWTPAAWASNTWYTTPELKTLLQAIVDRGGWAGDGVVFFWRDAPGWGGAWRVLYLDSYEANSSWGPKLDIDYSEGFVTGAAVLSGVGSMAVSSAITLPAKVAMSGVGTMVVAGTKGTTQTGAVVLSGVGGMSVDGVITASGKAALSGVGSMAVAGRRIFTGVAAMSGVGSMSVIGEVAGLLEGRAVLSGVGSMSVIGQRIVGGKASISGVGSMTTAGVSTLAGKVAMSGVGTMSALGETGEALFTIFGGISRVIDPDDYPDGAQFFLAATISAKDGTARARLYNITDASEVADSEITTSFYIPVPRRSAALSLPSGPKWYRIEYGGTPGGQYTAYAADLIVESG